MYPHFKKIEIEDKSIFDSFIKYGTYSDFNLLSLLSWDADTSNSYSILNGNLVISIKDYLTNSRIYSLLGITDIDATINQLVKDYKTLFLVPDIVIQNLNSTNAYLLKEDRDSFDYILSTEQLSKLSGNKFKQLRKHVHHFEKNYSDIKLLPVDLKNQDEIVRIRDLTSSWVTSKQFDTAKLNEELLILDNFLNYSKYFNCVLLGLYIGNKLIAYTFNEIIENKVAMGHFGKSDNSYRYSSYYIEYLTSEYFYKKGVLILNHEQDTGLQGLRATKMTYQPITFLKKYQISLR